MQSKDKLLIRFMKSYKFIKLSQQEKIVELNDYKYQKINFKGVNHEQI